MSGASASVKPGAHVRPRVVVLLRGREWDSRYRDLLSRLAGRETFDVVALFQGAPPTHEFEVPLVRYDLDSLRSLGFEPDSEEMLDHCSDLLLEHARRSLPDYDFYVMVGHEVDVGPGVVERLVDALAAEPGRDLDLVGCQLVRVTWFWGHSPNAARFFDPIWAMLMPFVVLSRRAVERLYIFRVEEGPSNLPTLQRVFGDALGSLFMNNGAYRTVDLNQLVPSAYDFSSVYYGPPMLYGVRPPGAPAGRVRHPVCSGDVFLERHLPQAQATDLRPFVAALSDPDLPVSPDVRQRYLARAQSLTPPADPPAIAAPLREPFSAVLLVDDDDLPVRDRGDSPRAMTEVTGRPLFRRVLDRLWAAGVGDVVVCLGPNSTSVREHLLATFVPEPDDGGLERLVDPQNGRSLRLTPSEGVLGARWGAALDPRSTRPLLIVFGSVWADVDLQALVAAHAGQDRLMTLAVAPASSMLLAMDEAMRLVADHRPGLGDLRVEAGYAIVEPALFGDMQRVAPARDLLLGAVADPERFSLYEHSGACWTANSAREAALLDPLSRAYPAVFHLDAQFHSDPSLGAVTDDLD